MKTPADKTIAFLYVSHPMPDARLKWSARLTFPPGATAETVLTLEVLDGLSVPVAEGAFEVAGQRLAVRNGQATVTYADFVKGHHETALWLYRPGCPPVPGGLTFG